MAYSNGRNGDRPAMPAWISPIMKSGRTTTIRTNCPSPMICARGAEAVPTTHAVPQAIPARNPRYRKCFISRAMAFTGGAAAPYTVRRRVRWSVPLRSVHFLLHQDIHQSLVVKGPTDEDSCHEWKPGDACPVPSDVNRSDRTGANTNGVSSRAAIKCGLLAVSGRPVSLGSGVTKNLIWRRA